MKSNGIRIKEQKKVREKRRQNLRNLKEESLQRIRGRTRRENFNEELRKAERNRTREKYLLKIVKNVHWLYIVKTFELSAVRLQPIKRIY